MGGAHTSACSGLWDACTALEPRPTRLRLDVQVLSPPTPTPGPLPPPAGAIRYGPHRYRAISKFALVVLRERNPSRQSCDGWKEVAWNGEKLDLLRCAARGRGGVGRAACLFP